MDGDFVPSGDRWHNTRWKLVVGGRGGEVRGVAVDVRHRCQSYEFGLLVEDDVRPRMRMLGPGPSRRVPRSTRWALMKMLLDLAGLRPNTVP